MTVIRDLIDALSDRIAELEARIASLENNPPPPKIPELPYSFSDGRCAPRAAFISPSQ